MCEHLPDLDPRVRRHFIQLVSGIFESRSLLIEAIAATSPFSALPHSNATQVRRILRDHRLTLEQVFYPFVRSILATVPGTELYLTVDATSHGADYNVMQLGWATDGMSLPLAFLVYAPDAPWADETRAVIQLLDAVIPDHFTVTLLADRGFIGTPFVTWLDGLRWNYIVRARSFFSIALGKQRNPVQEAMQIIVPYITQKDADGVCRVAYWAAGNSGKEVEVIGELDAETAANYKYHGPKEFGGGTYLLPAVRDFVNYIQELQKTSEVKAALGIIVTDGQIHDFDAITKYTRELASAIMSNKFPPANIVLVGVGESVDHEQMEQLGEVTPESYTGRDIWCCAEAESVDDLPELVAHLIDANTPAFWGGAVLKDEKGAILQTWEDMVPAVFEFTVPKKAKSFTLQVGSDVFTQSLDFPEEHH